MLYQEVCFYGPHSLSPCAFFMMDSRAMIDDACTGRLLHGLYMVSLVAHPLRSASQRWLHHAQELQTAQVTQRAARLLILHDDHHARRQVPRAAVHVGWL